MSTYPRGVPSSQTTPRNPSFPTWLDGVRWYSSPTSCSTPLAGPSLSTPYPSTPPPWSHVWKPPHRSRQYSAPVPWVPHPGPMETPTPTRCPPQTDSHPDRVTGFPPRLPGRGMGVVLVPRWVRSQRVDPSSHRHNREELTVDHPSSTVTPHSPSTGPGPRLSTESPQDQGGGTLPRARRTEPIPDLPRRQDMLTDQEGG